MSLRGLARSAGVSHSFLSRAIRGAESKSISGDLAARIALALGYPGDYFPEFREDFVLSRIRDDGKLRDELYDRMQAVGDGPSGASSPPPRAS